MPSVVTLPHTLPSNQQQLLQGLEDSGEQVFARTVAANYGFRISNRWDRTAKNVAEDLASTGKDFQNCTIDSLEQLVDRVIISANHHYSVYELSQIDAVSVRQALSAIVGQPQNNQYSQHYPAKVDFDSTPNTPTGHFLCKVVDMGDGFACIFSSVEKEAPIGFRSSVNSMILSQFFHTVFVPHKKDRYEVRISDKAPARYLEEHATSINNEFINTIGEQGVKFRRTSINFYNCIKSYFSDQASGRIAHAVLTTDQDSKDAELKSLRNRDYCARSQQVVDTKNNFDYICRAILIRKPYLGNTLGEIDISFFPHKNVWEANQCWTIQVKKPQTSTALNSIITDAITRS
ncbi:hypothetical protein [Agarivorans sp. Z349TD_8]|uniref:hypothetical protein n=1 Tax=Agarivorans sp. Z349TD_8 TaxID=3421434 RepID=UPI003D7C5A19